MVGFLGCIGTVHDWHMTGTCVSGWLTLTVPMVSQESRERVSEWGWVSIVWRTCFMSRDFVSGHVILFQVT